MLQYETVDAAGSASPRRKPAVPRLPSACYKPSPAKQLTQIFKELRQLMNAEWSNIRSMNLGVRSGTAAVTDALYRQLQQLVLQLHALVIQHEEAGAVLVQLAGSLSLMEGQQLQVLLDTTGHEELSDYLKLLLKDAWSQPDWLPASALRRGAQDAAAANSSTSSSIGSGKGGTTGRTGTKFSGRSTGMLGATGRSGRLGGSSLRASREGTGAASSGDTDGDSGGTSPGRRGCSMPTAMIAEIARQRLLAEDDEVQLRPSILNKGDKSLRFRRCCHPHSPLVVTAEQLQQELQFQQELAEAEAAAAAAASGSAGQHGSRQGSGRMLRSYNGRSTLAGDPGAFAASMRRPGTSSRGALQQLMDLGPALSWGSESWPGSPWGSRPTSGQLAAARAASAAARRDAARYQPLTVPCTDVETVWAEGRAAAGLTTLAVTHAEQLLLSGLDSIVLADGISYQPRHQQQAQGSAEGGSPAPASSSRSSIRSAAMAALAANKSSSSIQGSSGAAQEGSGSQADICEVSETPGRATAAVTPACKGGRRSTVAWREAAGIERTGSTSMAAAGDKQTSLLRPAAGQQGLGLASVTRPAVAAAAAAAGNGGSGATGSVPELPVNHLRRPSSASSSTNGLPTPPMSARSAGGQPMAATC